MTKRDEEIVKALECCKSGTTDDCKCCPRLDDERDLSTEDCMEKLMHDAIDLINLQKETIEQLKTALFKCGEDAVEIENYKKIAEHQQSISMDRFFEIQRLKEEIERLKNLNIKLDEYIIRARAEAVKEFAERLKEDVEKMQCHGYTFYCVGHGFVDNLVKEFTEGGDGGQSMQEKLS